MDTDPKWVHLLRNLEVAQQTFSWSTGKYVTNAVDTLSAAEAAVDTYLREKREAASKQ